MPPGPDTPPLADPGVPAAWPCPAAGTVRPAEMLPCYGRQRAPAAGWRPVAT